MSRIFEINKPNKLNKLNIEQLTKELNRVQMEYNRIVEDHVFQYTKMQYPHCDMQLFTNSEDSNFHASRIELSRQLDALKRQLETLHTKSNDLKPKQK